jgi:hypothetical protein
MKTQNIITIQLAAILAASLLVGCSHRVSAPTGSWRGDSGETLAIQKDGTFTLKNVPPNNKTGEQRVRDFGGTYTMVDSTHMKLDIATPNGTVSQICTVLVSGSDLSFQPSDSSEVKTYHRATN